MSQQMFIDARVAGSNDDPVRVIAMIDNQNDELIITKFLPYQLPKDPYKGKTAEQVAQMKQIKANTVVVVDNPTAFREWDIAFNEVDHLEEAIRAYLMMHRLGRLILDESIRAQCDPVSVIEVRKTELRGSVYELNSDEVTNSHFAVLISCWVSLRMMGTSRIVENEVEPTQHDIDTFNVPFSI